MKFDDLDPATGPDLSSESLHRATERGAQLRNKRRASFGAGILALALFIGLGGVALSQASQRGDENLRVASGPNASSTSSTSTTTAPLAPPPTAPIEQETAVGADPCGALTPEQLAEIQSTFEKYGHLFNLTLEEACRGYFDFFVTPDPPDETPNLGGGSCHTYVDEETGDEVTVCP